MNTDNIIDELGYGLRDYQQDDFDAITSYIDDNESILYQLTTGGGKSIVMSKVIEYYKDKKILFLVHRTTLVTQMIKHIHKLGLSCGVMTSKEENLDSDIIVASVQTAFREKRIEKLNKKVFDLIIIDEAHHIRSNSFETIIKAQKDKNPNITLFGCTATPFRMDKKGFDEMFDVLHTSIPPYELLEKDYLSDIIIVNRPQLGLENVKTNSNDYQLSELSEFMNKDNKVQMLVDMHEKNAYGVSTIIFAVDVNHAKNILQEYENRGYNMSMIAYIDASTSISERERIFEAYKKNEILTLITIETITEGQDLPNTNCVLMGRPTKSIILYLQMVGRGTRPKEDGSALLLLDFANNTLTLGHPYEERDWSLKVDKNINKSENRVILVERNGELVVIDDIEEIEEDEEIEIVEIGEAIRLLQEKKEVAERINEKNKKEHKELKDLLEDSLIKSLKLIDESLNVGKDYSCIKIGCNRHMLIFRYNLHTDCVDYGTSYGNLNKSFSFNQEMHNLFNSVFDVISKFNVANSELITKFRETSTYDIININDINRSIDKLCENGYNEKLLRECIDEYGFLTFRGNLNDFHGRTYDHIRNIIRIDNDNFYSCNSIYDTYKVNNYLNKIGSKLSHQNIIKIIEDTKKEFNDINLYKSLRKYSDRVLNRGCKINIKRNVMLDSIIDSETD